MGFTENCSPTFLSSSNPCLDFFFHVVPNTPPETLTQRLELAWKHDPLKTLKLLCNLRGVRGTGKSDKEGGYTAALWLHKNHPKTLACNDSSYDQTTLLCEPIAKKVFPREEYPEYEGVEEAHYAYRVRDRLRKQVLVPLRKTLELPEVYMRVVDDMAKKGKLNNCLAICDVSGSMSGIPMEVSVALGVLVSELSDEPWKGKLITFSANPQLQTVGGNSLKEKTEFVRRMEWGMNTDFQKVFDLLLQVAVNGKLKPEQMIKRLFVFSDMEFDQASTVSQYQHQYTGWTSYYPYTNQVSHQNHRTWETDYEAIVRKFTEKGYGDCVPEIVFWNLRDSRATPVPGNKPGVALVSGYSKNLMTLFLEEGRIANPPEDEAVTEVGGVRLIRIVIKFNGLVKTS
ncbi:uncharacterized protein l728 [Phtheirospermum japonicum]|uniref:Uncharacterized protein l728 n=1 Tax=Phtheirospermum japonicum TaxID=374723 RepID=A0A830CVM3_9LAMI|nr:uncharacterized protein l728 [Phtheirospermum japonicum]